MKFKEFKEHVCAVQIFKNQKFDQIKSFIVLKGYSNLNSLNRVLHLLFRREPSNLAGRSQCTVHFGNYAPFRGLYNRFLRSEGSRIGPTISNLLPR